MQVARRMSPHLDRLFNSAAEVGITIPYSKEDFIKIIQEGLHKNANAVEREAELYIKAIVTGGCAPDAISTSAKPSVIVLFIKAAVYPEVLFTEGIKVMTVPFERYLPKVKSLNYMAAVVTLQKAKQQGYDEVIYCSPSSGNILEGTTVNFAVVMNNKVYTAEDDILYGITRKFLLEKVIPNVGNIEVVRGPLHSGLIPKFEEAFILSTTKEVMPVTTIDGKPVGNGKVGPLTSKIMSAFSQAARSHEEKL